MALADKMAPLWAHTGRGPEYSDLDSKWMWKTTSTLW